MASIDMQNYILIILNRCCLGAYSHKTFIGETPSYSMASGRSQMVSKDAISSPGPGNYGDISSLIGKDGPAFTMSGRLNEKITSDGVGPGNSINISFSLSLKLLSLSILIWIIHYD